MRIVQYALLELTSYGAFEWMLFIGTAFAAGYLARLPGVLIGHAAVAFLVGYFDVQWVQSEMQKPEWNGVPDQDGVFMIGMLFRIVLINAIVLPVSVVGWRLRQGRPHSPQADASRI